uniref:C2 calcium/lipid-binding domain, CaLB n=1 Tax=Tanacetum cinerariifolium TaxID=118510 RepID=A0A6L2J118_TANCI|nr:C2 calcium/lipid-binding domain, CaLB [Tanacetum cinerariifolium]
MTKVIKGEFEKLEDLKVKDVSLTCDTSLEVYNNEFNRMSEMDNDLFTYEVEVAKIPCNSKKYDDYEQQVSHEANDDMGYDPSDIALTEWLGLKKFNYEMMDHHTKKALWIYWIRGDDEVELSDEEFLIMKMKLLKQELREAHELPVCNMRRFKMIKYSFRQDEAYVAIKDDEYDDLAKTSDDACRAHQEIFRMMDEGMMVTRAE